MPKIHIPTFLAASICLFLGLCMQWLHTNAEEWVFSIILMFVGFCLFCTVKREKAQTKPKFSLPLKTTIFVILLAAVFQLFTGGMYIKLFHYIDGLLQKFLVK
jgi:phosphatidylserine synthase